MEDPNDKSLYRGGSRHSPLYDVVREGREHPAGAGGGKGAEPWLRLERGVPYRSCYILCAGCSGRGRSRDSCLACRAVGKPIGLFQNIQETTERRCVSFREQVFGFRCQLVDVSRLAAIAAAAYRTSLPHNAIALEDGEMRADAVDRETQRPGKLLDGAVGPSEQRNHPPPRAFEELLFPARSQ